MKSALAAAALAAALAPAAAGAAVPRDMRIVKARGTVEVGFAGDSSGSVKYAFGGRVRDGLLHFVRTRSGKLRVGIGEVSVPGTTTARTTAPSGTVCSDSRSHRGELFGLTPKGRDRVSFTYHRARSLSLGFDYLRTRCSGPDERALAKARALPAGSFPITGFRGRTATMRLTGSNRFVTPDFNGTVQWRMTFVLASKKR